MIVVDTHVWLWWSHDPAELSERARGAIETEEDGGSIVVSSMSVWEIAVKVQLGKLALPMPIDRWYEAASTYPSIAVEPLDPFDAIESTRLPGHLHGDPADRILIALARRLAVPLVTRDRRILSYPHVQTFW